MFFKSQGFKEGRLAVAVSLVEHRSVFKFNSPPVGSVTGWAGLNLVCCQDTESGRFCGWTGAQGHGSQHTV